MTQYRLMVAKSNRLWLDTNNCAKSLTSRRPAMVTLETLGRCNQQWSWIRSTLKKTMRTMIWEEDHLICTFSSMKSQWCKSLSLKSIMMLMSMNMMVGRIHLSHLLDTSGLESTSRSYPANKTCFREKINIRSHLKQWISLTKMAKITRMNLNRLILRTITTNSNNFNL